MNMADLIFWGKFEVASRLQRSWLEIELELPKRRWGEHQVPGFPSQLPATSDEQPILADFNSYSEVKTKGIRILDNQSVIRLATTADARPLTTSLGPLVFAQLDEALATQ